MRTKLVDSAKFIKLDFEQTKSLFKAFQFVSLFGSAYITYWRMTILEVNRLRAEIENKKRFVTCCKIHLAVGGAASFGAVWRPTKSASDLRDIKIKSQFRVGFCYLINWKYYFYLKPNVSYRGVSSNQNCWSIHFLIFIWIFSN